MRNSKGFITEIASSSYRGMEWSYVTDYLTGADQKTWDRLIKIIFLVKVETAIRLGIKSRFGILGFSTSDAIWGLWFLFLTA